MQADLIINSLTVRLNIMLGFKQVRLAHRGKVPSCASCCRDLSFGVAALML